jgi:lysyl-tRNA synthetase class 2
MQLYLRIAPELYLKRLLVGGFERFYEINRNFRNEGISVRHNPEFTMMELYTAWWNYLDTMDLLEDLLRGAARAVLGTAKVPYLGREVDFESPFARRKMLDRMCEALNLPADVELKWGPDGEAGAHQALEAAPASVQAEVKGTYETGDELLVKLFEECAEKNLWQPTIVYVFPEEPVPPGQVFGDRSVDSRAIRILRGRPREWPTLLRASTTPRNRRRTSAARSSGAPRATKKRR